MTAAPTALTNTGISLWFDDHQAVHLEHPLRIFA